MNRPYFLVKISLNFRNKMSLSLIKRELELASEEKEVTKSNKKRSKVNHLGTARHGMKKRLKKMKSQKKISDRFSFKFSTEDPMAQEDKTLKCLEQLNKLDKISKKVSSTKIVEDVSKKKRQSDRQAPSASKSKRKEEDKSSILLSEAEVAAIEKAYFLHSKEKPKPKDDWD